MKSRLPLITLSQAYCQLLIVGCYSLRRRTLRLSLCLPGRMTSRVSLRLITAACAPAALFGRRLAGGAAAGR